MILQNFKQTIVEKFDKVVKTATNRAIPTMKKEAAKIMKTSSTKTMTQITEVAKFVIVTAVLFSPNGIIEQVAPVATNVDKLHDVNIMIDNLTINFKGE